jgi:rSAM/selenodomain-associated transferase 1
MGADRGSALLIQFARAPEAGAVKTRMLSQLSPHQACELHAELVLWTCRRLTAAGVGAVELAVAGDTLYPLFRECRAAGVSAIYRQRGRDLGERMYRAMCGGLARFDRVILVGSDCPWIDRSYLEAALEALDAAPLALGPALDGGYVLIAARQVRPELFSRITWGTDAVLAETRARLGQLGWAWRELPALRDVDRPEDLPAWHRLRADEAAGTR